MHKKWSPLQLHLVREQANRDSIMREISCMTDLSPQGSTSLHYAVLSGNSSAVKCLLEYGALVEKVNLAGETPLHWACQFGNPEIVEMLIIHGADVNATDFSGSTPLHWAAENDWEDVVCLLILYGASHQKRNNRGKTAYQVALKHESRSVRSILRPTSSLSLIRAHVFV